MASSPHHELMERRSAYGFSESKLIEMCEEVGIDPETLTPYARTNLECMYQYPESQLQFLREIKEENEAE